MHSASLSPDSYHMIAATGGSVSVSTESECSAGQGYPPTWKLRKYGIPVSLSQDTSVWWSGDIFSAMRATLSADRVMDHFENHNEGKAVTNHHLRAEQVVDWATRGGAKAIGLDSVVGSVEEGKKADLVLIKNDDSPVSFPILHPYGHVVYQAQRGDVHTVVVNGRVVKFDHKLVGVDLAKARRAIDETTGYLRSELGEQAWDRGHEPRGPRARDPGQPVHLHRRGRLEGRRRVRRPPGWKAGRADHAVSDWRICAVGMRAPTRAGTVVSPATARRVPSTAATTHSAVGRAVWFPPTALNRRRPSGTPRMAPGSADSTCADIKPELICSERAPSARISADGRLVSSVVAQAVKIAFRADSVISMMVVTVSTCSFRLTIGSASPPTGPPIVFALALTVAWKASTVTIPATVTAVLAALSTARRGLRAAIRSPSSTGTGSLLERLISAPWRRGGRAESASALTVLDRAARTAGASVEASVTMSATHRTATTISGVSEGAPGAPTRAAPGLVSSGAVSHPAISPAAPAISARTRFSARNVAAIRPGVPPAALSSPTRRVFSASRPPTRTATLASASRQRSAAPGTRTACSSLTSSPSAAAMSGQERG